MRKKLKLLAVVLCLAVFGIMALGSSSSDDDEKKEIVTNSDGSVVSDGVSDNTDVTIAEQVLLDQNGIVITAQEYVNDSIWGEGIKMVLENNSDKDVTVGCSALIVNNYMITDLFVSDVAVGKKANETMWLSSSELKAAGIDSVGQVEIYFHI